VVPFTNSSRRKKRSDELLRAILRQGVSLPFGKCRLGLWRADKSAMDKAPAMKVMNEMIRKQTLPYNSTRQALITKELIEIISGRRRFSKKEVMG